MMRMQNFVPGIYAFYKFDLDDTKLRAAKPGPIRSGEREGVD